MRKSRLSWYKQERLIEHFVSVSTARTAAKIVHVNKTTAPFIFTVYVKLFIKKAFSQFLFMERLKWMKSSVKKMRLAFLVKM